MKQRNRPAQLKNPMYTTSGMTAVAQSVLSDVCRRR